MPFKDTSKGMTHYSCPTRLLNEQGEAGCCSPECLNPHECCDYQVWEAKGVAFTSSPEVFEEYLKKLERRGDLAWNFVGIGLMVLGVVVIILSIR